MRINKIKEERNSRSSFKLNEYFSFSGGKQSTNWIYAFRLIPSFERFPISTFYILHSFEIRWMKTGQIGTTTKDHSLSVPADKTNNERFSCSLRRGFRTQRKLETRFDPVPSTMAVYIFVMDDEFPLEAKMYLERFSSITLLDKQLVALC